MTKFEEGKNVGILRNDIRVTFWDRSLINFYLAFMGLGGYFNHRFKIIFPGWIWPVSLHKSILDTSKTGKLRAALFGELLNDTPSSKSLHFLNKHELHKLKVKNYKGLLFCCTCTMHCAIFPWLMIPPPSSPWLIGLSLINIFFW